LVVTTEKYDANLPEYAKFDSCSKEVLKTFRHGIHARTFNVYLCKNFQGIVYGPGEVPPSSRH
ncbi:MAG TPA: hypothetical protein VN132_07865, partial [Bdellovibrio sp.]|nr:hypothetical protein [Bdellovibrio sp.]